MREEIDEALGNITILFKKDGGIELDGKDKAVVELQALITKAQSEVFQAVRGRGPLNVTLGHPDDKYDQCNREWHTAINTIAKERGLE